MFRTWCRYLAEFIEASRRGWPATRRFLYTVFQLALAAATVLGVALAPWLINQIDDPVYRVLAWVLVVGSVVLVAIVLSVTPYLGQRRITQDVVERANELKARIEALHPLVVFRDGQIGNEHEYLRLVVEELDLSQRVNAPADQVILSFQIDSGLMFDFGPLDVEVEISVNQRKSALPFRMPGRRNLLAGRRSQFASELVTIHGEAIKQALSEARKDGQGEVSVTVYLSVPNRPNPIPLSYGPRTHLARAAAIRL